MRGNLKLRINFWKGMRRKRKEARVVQMEEREYNQNIRSS